MSFTILKNSTTADATEVNDNFYHVAQGDRFPRGGTSLDATTGVYDIGSSNYHWQEIHFNNLTSPSENVLKLIADVVLSATASSIEVDGLNGDSDNVYYIYLSIKGYTGSCYMSINNDTGTNYGHNSAIFGDITLFASATASKDTGITYIEATKQGDTTTNIYSYSEMIFYAKSGHERCILNQCLDGYDSSFISDIRFSGHAWGDTSSTVTSMKFEKNFSPNTQLKIFAMR